jgi:hypothetical protein
VVSASSEISKRLTERLAMIPIAQQSADGARSGDAVAAYIVTK